MKSADDKLWRLFLRMANKKLKPHGWRFEPRKGLYEFVLVDICSDCGESKHKCKCHLSNDPLH